ncbi:MAG: cytochrome c oxidase subunit II [Candidatus Rokuibacteriota bacterium]|nr:MAG: cytochrome c oxidase subunit II [Candidatus Rokubacteria bacterium]
MDQGPIGAELAASDHPRSVPTAQTPSIFDPVSSPALAIRELSFVVLGLSAVIFVVVAGVAAYTLVRFRNRPGDGRREPPQVYGSTQIELAWTVVPFLIVMVLFLVTARYIYGIEGRAMPSDALEVTVVGNQWWWEIRYPRLGIVTANELHVPVSDPARPAPTFITLQSVDVIHSFWVPQLAGKMDLIPNKTNRMWIDPRVPGTYVGQCAEYCGTQHAWMLLEVIVHPRDEFDRWVAAQQTPAVTDPAVRAGRELFLSLSCINCHTVRGTPANGVFGPDLTHLMSRRTIAAGAARNTPEALRAWVDAPGAIKPGVRMPAMKLAKSELDSLTTYLLTLR